MMNTARVVRSYSKTPGPWVRKPRAEEAYYLLLPHCYEDEPPVG